MSIEQFPGSHTNLVDVLSLREEILVKSASIIDDDAFKHKQWLNLPEGRVFWADWTDPIDDVDFQLQALGERVYTGEVQFSYWLRGYTTVPAEAFIDFRYRSCTQKILLRNETGNYKKAKPEEVDMLHGCLASFGTDLSEEEIDAFIGNMQANEIYDPRLSSAIKRKYGRFILGRDY